MMTMFSEWLQRVSGEEIAKGHIQQLYQRIYPLAHGYGHVGGKKTNIDADQAGIICERLEQRGDGGPRVTAAQAQQGADWLVRYGKRLGLPEALIEQRPLWFQFPGCTHREFGRDGIWLPVYDAYYQNGDRLEYSTGSWQSQTAAFEFTYHEAKVLA